MKRLFLAPLITLMIILIAWEFAASFLKSPLILPSLSSVISTFWEMRLSILSHTLVTSQRVAIGFVFGILIGVGLGLLLGYSTTIYSSFYPFLTAFYCVPKQALVPILVMWTGFGTLPAILTSLITAFFPVLVNVATGVSTINPDLADMFRSLGGTKKHIFMKVGIPSSLPYFFASLRVAGIGALIGVVVSEMIAAKEGVGFMILMAGIRFESSLLFAYVVVSALIGIIIYAICTYVDRRFAWWAYRGG